MSKSRWLTVVGASLAIAGAAHAAEPLQFDVTQGLASGPPYPATALQIEAGTAQPPEPVVPVEIVALTLEAVCQPPEPCTPVSFELAATDTGGDVGLFGGELNVDWGQSPDDAFPATGLSVEGLFELAPPSAASPSPVMGINPCVMPTAAGFELRFEAEIPGVGIADHVAHFTVTPGQGLSFSNVQVGALQGAGFPLTFDLLPTGSVDENEPLFTTTVSGTLGPLPVPVLSPGALAALCGAIAVTAAVAIRRKFADALPIA